MSHFQPVRPADRHRFDAIIDARSPAEFAEDHIPGAINCPVLDNEERAIVGTLYVQQGAFEARRVGGAMVAANLAKHLKHQLADMPENWKPLVYCWRGGMRSGSMVHWLRLVGWDAQQLAGGYKSFRRHVISQIEDIVPRLDLRVIVGATGSAKTRVLQALEAQGAQMLDLEHCARHKGSLLGTLPGTPQPTQKNFETQIGAVLETLDLSRPLYVEGESARIGRLTVPLPLVAKMRAAPTIEIAATHEARLAYLLRDYAYLGDDVEALVGKLGVLTESLGKETVGRWQTWARDRSLSPLFDELMRLHYDPHYQRSQSSHFDTWEQRQRIEASALTQADVEQIAAQILALERDF
ncbi:tRNA 2-selenouridine(34) synthase MnmH [Diaphorobacter aerolatus]|uniref:tRNA 2-selenouridine(34) synthase MnmH n=1 Tax=Diaphorobacter aerolatus TaxID=1288495 RepID=A0A7H0GHW2_9BURK|nr:tRNA 2-selenouridine(34) synthase MnmH [Diaphorobacter aerolatus]QNP47878.1 tRNA 2-selenouridine(34) synthase MnmH [Diaphorobacter aerolatus]